VPQPQEPLGASRDPLPDGPDARAPRASVGVELIRDELARIDVAND